MACNEACHDDDVMRGKGDPEAIGHLTSKDPLADHDGKKHGPQVDHSEN